MGSENSTGAFANASKLILCKRDLSAFSVPVTVKLVSPSGTIFTKEFNKVEHDPMSCA